jgi:hypothetical protein
MNSSSRNYSAGSVMAVAICTLHDSPPAERAIRLHRKISLSLFQAFAVFEKSVCA